jgi:hypothetical protein
VRSSPCRAANRPDQAIGNCGRGRASVLHVGRSKTVRAPLAQLAEQLTLNQRVRGSSPWRRTESPGQWPGLFLVFSGIRTFPNTSFADPSSPNESSSAPSNRLATEVDVLGRQRSSASSTSRALQPTSSRIVAAVLRKTCEVTRADCSPPRECAGHAGCCSVAQVAGAVREDRTSLTCDRSRSMSAAQEAVVAFVPRFGLGRLANQAISFDANHSRVHRDRVASKSASGHITADTHQFERPRPS